MEINFCVTGKYYRTYKTMYGKRGYLFIKPGFESGLELGLEPGLEPGLDSGLEPKMTSGDFDG